MHGLVHKHLKKRKGESKNSSDAWKQLLDKATLAAGVIGPMTDIPQILKILVTHNAAGVSALAWAGAAVLDIPFFLYGMAHKDKPIALTYSLWFIGNIVILILTVMYS